MSTNIFIPTKIKVGYQSRTDTYTQKLAYVIYFDEKGKLRKETSWNSWRDEKIDSNDFENVPTTGFVLNKKVGDYKSDWSHRMAYVRVYDPRNFEFEITVDNLLYILENATSTKGKGLEGEFVYGWSGKDLVLIPCESPDYQELKQLNNKRHERKSFKGSDMIIGGAYLTKDNKEVIYLGHYLRRNKTYKETKQYFFFDRSIVSKWNQGIVEIGTLTGNILDEIDNKCVEDYSELIDILMNGNYVSTRDCKKDEYKEYTFEEFSIKNKTIEYHDNFFQIAVEK